VYICAYTHTHTSYTHTQNKRTRLEDRDFGFTPQVLRERRREEGKVPLHSKRIHYTRIYTHKHTHCTYVNMHIQPRIYLRIHVCMYASLHGGDDPQHALFV